jgi:hypothetical protein
MHAIRCGSKPHAEVASKLGYDIEETDAEIAADNRRAEGKWDYFDFIVAHAIPSCALHLHWTLLQNPSLLN